MNRLQLLQNKLTQSTTTKPQINWIEIDLPYSLKDECRVKFKGHIRFDGDTTSWLVNETIADKFEKIYLEDFVNPTKEQKLLLKQNGANFDKNAKLWYLLSYQTEEVVEPTDEN